MNNLYVKIVQTMVLEFAEFLHQAVQKPYYVNSLAIEHAHKVTVTAAMQPASSMVISCEDKKARAYSSGLR